MSTSMFQLDPVLVAPPAERPVSLAQMKRHLAVDHDEDDDLIGLALDAAVDQVQRLYGVAPMRQRWRAFLACWPASRTIGLVRRPVQVPLIEISVNLPDGGSQCLDLSGVSIARSDDAPLVVLPLSLALPAPAEGPGAIAVTFDAGWENADAVPAALRWSLMLIAADHYRFRESVSTGSIVRVETWATVSRMLGRYWAPIV